jgi:hypothetical protein
MQSRAPNRSPSSSPSSDPTRKIKMIMKPLQTDV